MIKDGYWSQFNSVQVPSYVSFFRPELLQTICGMEMFNVCIFMPASQYLFHSFALANEHLIVVIDAFKMF